MEVTKKLKGSTVIEMAYIIPLFFLIFIVIVHTVFYFHDKAVLTGAASETAAAGSQLVRRKKTVEYDLEKFFQERIRKKLIYITDVDVKIENGEELITVSVSAHRNAMKINIRQSSVTAEPEERIRWLN